MTTPEERRAEVHRIARHLAEYAEAAGMPGSSGMGLAYGRRLEHILDEEAWDAEQRTRARYAQLPLPLT